MADLVKLAILICSTCKRKAIKAPAGATPETKYTCAACTRLMPGSGFVEAPFYRRPVQDQPKRYGKVAQSWWDRWCIANRTSTRNEVDAEQAAVFGITQDQLEKILEDAERTNPGFQKYSNRRWVRALSADALMELSELERRCLMLVSILGISVNEAAKALHIRKETVKTNNLRAQKRLTNKDITKPRNILKTRYIKSCIVN